MCSVTGAESGEDVISMGLPDTRSLTQEQQIAGARGQPGRQLPTEPNS